MCAKRIVVGMSGASGTPLAVRCLQTLQKADGWEVHLVASRAARITASHEWPEPFERIEAIADFSYDEENIGAPIASGTFDMQGMIVIPCSMKTVAGIASGYSDNLLLRAADVTLKEGHPLVLMPRESPLSAVHCRNLETLSRIPGVSICPPMLAYYNRPTSIEDMERGIVGRALQRIGVDAPGLQQWTGLSAERTAPHIGTGAR